jgi:hypothetical protein
MTGILNVGNSDPSRGERVHDDFGILQVYGQGGEHWYSVYATNLSQNDWQRIMNDEPESKPYALTNANLLEWRKSARNKMKITEWRKGMGE